MRQHAEPSTGRISLKQHSCLREKYKFENRTKSPLVRFHITEGILKLEICVVNASYDFTRNNSEWWFSKRNSFKEKKVHISSADSNHWTVQNWLVAVCRSHQRQTRRRKLGLGLRFTGKIPSTSGFYHVFLEEISLQVRVFTRCFAECGSHTTRWAAFSTLSNSATRIARASVSERSSLFAVKSSLLKRCSHGFRKSATHNSTSSESSAFPPRVKSVQYWNWSTLSRHHYSAFIENNNTIWRCRPLNSNFQQTYVFFNYKLPYHQMKLNV